jgi:hypothetical protein
MSVKQIQTLSRFLWRTGKADLLHDGHGKPTRVSRIKVNRIGGSMKKLLILAVALLFLIPLARTAFAAPAAQATTKLTRVSVKGTMQSVETYAINVPTMSVSASGSGNAHELGQFTIKYSGEVNLLDLSWSESAQFIGVNGDSIHLQGVGQATQGNPPTVFDLVEIYTVTGGTGRLAGARGTMTLHRLANITTGSAAGTFEGYIFVP